MKTFRFYRRSLLGLVIISFSVLNVAIPELLAEEQASADAELARELSDMDIGALINLTVTSVSKKEQKISEAPAAIFVVTDNDIRRSGATSIPEALRLVPGLHVAKVSNNSWAIASRGFNGLFTNKLLVLIDGRTVYTPLFAGVFWDAQDVMLEDIDRIEVIRGPGATLWGANAVNGVINIITKSSVNTQGGLLSGGGGTEERGFANARYGGELSENASYRVYGKYFDRDNTTKDTGVSGDSFDAWDQAQGGFRVDVTPDEDTTVTVQGDAYYGELGSDFVIPALTSPFTDLIDANRRTNGQNLLVRYSKALSEESELQVQVYYDRVERDDVIIAQEVDTLDIDVQHRFSPLERHEIIWGGRFNYLHDDIEGTFAADVTPDTRNINLFSGFVQDEIELVEDTFTLIFGSKFEHNQKTDFEFQPSIKARWTPDERRTVWSAVSRSVRTPSRTNDDLILPVAVIPPSATAGTPLAVPTLFGNRSLDSEEIISFETGYRSEVNSRLSYDIATFFNIIDGVTTVDPLMTMPTIDASIGGVRVPLEFQNKLDGSTYGVEVVIDYRPIDDWRLVGSYTWLDMELHLATDSADTISEGEENQTPENQFLIRSIHDFPNDIEFDALLRYVDAVRDLPNADSYFELDLRLGWSPIEELELAVVGQNLLESQHKEYESDFITQDVTRIERGVYGKATYRF